MTEKGFENLSRMLKARDVGLGWLLGVTFLKSTHALSLQPHQHAHLEIIFCLKGELTYEIAGDPPITLGAGTGIVIPERTVHVLQGGTESPSERLGIHFARIPSRARAYAVFSTSDYASFRQTLATSAGRPFRLDKSLTGSVTELADYLRKPPETISGPDMGLVRILCCAILYRVVRTLSEPLVSLRPKLMAEAVSFLEEHFAEPIRTDDLVRHIGYSRARLFALFKEFTGLTPNEYLTRLRLRKAEEFLAAGHDVGETARLAGYPNAAYFGAVFKRYTGVTPGKRTLAAERRGQVR